MVVKRCGGEVNGTLRVNLNKNSKDEWIIDKTFGEIEKAINDGQVVYVVDTFNKPTISGARGYRTFYYDSYSSLRFGGDFYMFVSSSYGEIRILNIYFNRVSVHDIGVNAVLGEEVSSNDVLKLGDHGINTATPNVDYALPPLIVTITQDGEDSSGNPIYKSDKTYAEIKTAHEAEREVYARIYFGFWRFLRISEVNTAASRITFFSITMSLSGFSPTSMMIPIDYITLFVTDREGTDVVECESYELYVPTQTFTPELLNSFLSFRPEVKQELDEEQQETGRKRLSAAKAVPVTTADNGKFLRVVDGQWAADAAGGETWEKIAEIVIPEGADESTALTINKDSDGNPFSLVKARLCAKFPKYTGATTIPNFSFAMLNGKTTGRVTPLAYTSVWPKVSASIITGTVYEIDVSGVQQIEHVIRSANGGWSDDSSRDYVEYGAIPDTDTTWFGDTLLAKPITSIGGTGMLIYPGCRFVLYGVRA